MHCTLTIILICSLSITACYIFVYNREFLEISRFLYRVSSTITEETVGISFDGLVHENENGMKIDTVHRLKLPHRGVWIFIMDVSTKSILFVKRSKDTVTCPSTWSVCGEHARPREKYPHTVLRGLQEELQVSPENVLSIKQLNRSPELFHIDYGNARIDNQWTSTFLVTLHREDIHLDFQENTNIIWIGLGDIEKWLRRYADGNYISCQTNQLTVTNTGNGSVTEYRSFADLHMRYIQKIIQHNFSDASYS